MELTARRAERSADERCPYCHDALVAPAEDLVACPGCATHHHRACVEELGRCTIRGCERPLVAGVEADPSAGRARRASVTEEIRRRLRERVRHFVAEHSTAVEGPPPVRPAEPPPGERQERPPVGRLLTTAAPPPLPARDLRLVDQAIARLAEPPPTLPWTPEALRPTAAQVPLGGDAFQPLWVGLAVALLIVLFTLLALVLAG